MEGEELGDDRKHRIPWIEHTGFLLDARTKAMQTKIEYNQLGMEVSVTKAEAWLLGDISRLHRSSKAISTAPFSSRRILVDDMVLEGLAAAHHGSSLSSGLVTFIR